MFSSLYFPFVLSGLFLGLTPLWAKEVVTVPLDTLAQEEEEALSVCKVFYNQQSKLPKQDVTRLHLYQLLKPIDAYLKEVIDDLKLSNANTSQLEVLYKASSMCSQTIKSMENLVFLFNTKAYEAISQFRWQFLSVCQSLKEHGSAVSPRHIRELEPRVKKFHAAIFNYLYAHKEFMDAEETELFNEMNRFCSCLRFCILPGYEEYFCFSFVDTVTDRVFFRPLEFALDHKIASLVGAVVLVGGLWILKNKVLSA